ncbi:DNA-3-methyladenine glycosylase 2 family protein [candidate division KSB1 bacterium]|nr:DNA-3-methyladenine glycosylase 2 family protein [candidate division KSB1 bacterium]
MLNLASAQAHLARVDPVLAGIIARHGDYELSLDRQYFLSLVDAILSQQLGAGVSRQKMGYLRDLSEKWQAGVINPRRFARLNDEEIIDILTQVKGIGRWTAEMFLIFSLGRLDVLPVDDLGFRNAIKKAYRLRKLPEAKRIQKMAEKWRPYRSLATLYLW